MAVALRQGKRFPASSPVTRYWLANCVGFSLAGGGHGTVERVLADHDPYDPSLLEVRTSRRRVRRVPTSAVVAVIPSEQLLIIDKRRRLMPDRKRDVSLRLRWTARVAVRGVGVALRFVGVLSAAIWEL